MKKSTVTATFSSDIQKVWSVVTDNTNYSWRSDLSKIEVADDPHSFIEYTKDGFETAFIITVKKQYERYEFDMKNKNMNGHWTGVFSKTSTGGTQINFTEEIAVKNPMMKLLAGAYLKKQQSDYVSNLRKVLGE